MKGQEVVYSEPEIIQRQNGYDRIRRPILTEKEQAGRMKEREEAAAALIIAYRRVQAERKKRNEKNNGRVCSTDAAQQ